MIGLLLYLLWEALWAWLGHYMENERRWREVLA